MGHFGSRLDMSLSRVGLLARACRPAPRAFVRFASDGSLEGRYAEALFSAAEKQGSADAVYADMTSVRSYYKESSDFKLFVETPGISVDQKNAALKAIGKGFNPLSVNFLGLLLENKRLGLVSKMVDQFEELY